MPTAPRIPGPQVGTAPLPGVRAPVSAPIEAFGGGGAVANSFGQAAGAANEASKIFYERAAKEKKRALDIAETAQQNQLLQLRTDTELAMRKMQLGDAMRAPDVVDKMWKEGSDRIRKGIQDPDLQARFDLSEARDYGTLTARTKVHVSDEMEKFDDLEYASYVERLDDDAAKAGGAQVDINAALKAAKFEDWANRKDLSGEARDRARHELLSAGYAKAIRAQIDANNDITAGQMFEAYKDEMTERDRRSLAQGVAAASTKAESQQLVEAIFSTVPKSEKEALAEANRLTEGKSPDLRDQLRDRVHAQWGVEKREEARLHEEAYLEATNAVDTARPGETLEDVVPWDIRKTFTIHERENLKRVMAIKNAGKPRATDPQVYYTLRDMARNDPEAFMDENLLAYTSDLEQADLEKLIDLKDAFKKDDDKSRRKLDSFRTEDQIIMDTIKGEGYRAEGESTFQIRRIVDHQMDLWRINHPGKEPMREDYEGEVDKVLLDSAWKNKATEIQAVRRIPFDVRQEIVDALRKNNAVITDEAILNAYRDRAKEILENAP